MKTRNSLLWNATKAGVVVVEKPDAVLRSVGSGQFWFASSKT
jgi:hypothetical protein